jgi:hypothetical protein
MPYGATISSEMERTMSSGQIRIEWRPEFQPILDDLEAMSKRPLMRNALRVARALLALLKEGKTPTPSEVVEYVHVNDCPPSGEWIDFDRRKWAAYVPVVVSALNANNPTACVRQL